jgi:hypothetical protein
MKEQLAEVAQAMNSSTFGTTAFRQLVARSARNVSLGFRGRSPTQPQGCEPREDTSPKWGSKTRYQGSVGPQHKQRSTSTDEARYHNEKHCFCSNLLQVRSYTILVSATRHMN